MKRKVSCAASDNLGRPLQVYILRLHLSSIHLIIVCKTSRYCAMIVVTGLTDIAISESKMREVGREAKRLARFP